MQYTITHVPEEHGLIVELTGIVTGRDLLEINKAAWRAHDGRSLRWEIWDFRQAERIDASAEELRTIAILNHHSSHDKPPLRVATVGSRDVLAGADRIYNIFSTVWTEIESETFERPEDARAWVNGRSPASGEAH